MPRTTLFKVKVGTCYLYKARVTGTGYFPSDMLRYDNCFPADSESVVAMSERTADRTDRPRSVTLLTCTTGRIKTPYSVKRWASMGWTCVPI